MRSSTRAVSRSARRLAVVPAVVLALAALSCDSPVMRFLAYLWSPDRVVREGEHEVDVGGLERPIDIWFDRYAVPHVRAADYRELAFATGYLHGRDRRFQLELLRLAAAGRLREMIGRADRTGVLTNLELFGRAVGFEAEARAYLATAPPDDVAVLEAYARGIDAATAHEPRAMEFRLLDYRPEPWRPVDTAMIMAMVSFGLCKNWQLELGRLELMAHQVRSGGSIERALAIWPASYDLPPHLIGQRPERDPFADMPPVAPELVEYLRQWAAQVGTVAPGAGERHGGGGDGGSAGVFGHGGSRSNNWAMNGAWTGTGKGALSSDPHMVHALPPLGYLMHVAITGEQPVEVIGAGLVGLPSLSFATNGRVAWGVTANWADVTDLWVEKPVAGRPGYYLDRGREVAFSTRREEFKVRRPDGGFDVETRIIRSSRHGVLINGFIDRLPGDFPLVALGWSHGHGAISAMRGLYGSRNVGEARRVLQHFDAMVGHWALADDAGDIAYVGTAPLPLREHHLGTVPVPGWTGTYEWSGVVPGDHLPWLLNPPGGFFGTANNQVVEPRSQGYPIDSDGDVAYRFNRIMQVLGAGRGGRRPTQVTSRLQVDGFDGSFAGVREVTEAPVKSLCDDSDSRVAAAARAYLAWDGQVRPDGIGTTLDQSLCAMLVKRLLEDEMTPATVDWVLEFFNIEPFFYGLLTDPRNPAWDDRRTPAVERPAEVVPAVFRAMVAALAERYGDDVQSWTWSRAAPFVIQHPFGSQKLLAPLLNRGPLPTRGTGNTVFKHQFMRGELTHFPIKYGPVLRVNIDLADLAGSMMVLPGGQSGRPASPHYADLLPLYEQGLGVSMRMGFDGIERRTVGHLVLR